MNDIERFARYAAAFEVAYASDDWKSLEPYFHEDAAYEVKFPPPLGGLFEGREAILEYFPRILNAFDRRFATRTIQLLDGPTLQDGSVWILGRAIYTADGVPDLSFDLEETTTFDGDRIRRLQDAYTDETRQAMSEWVAAHGDGLGLEGWA